MREPIEPVDKPLAPRNPSRMNWLTWTMIGTVITAFLIFKQVNAVKPETAREWLKKGATVIDVRSEAEFQEKHLPGAINIPLTRLGDEIARVVPNKEQPLLLHCLSGTRSAAGEDTLKKMGYQNVLTLGSYGRAQKILSE